MHCLLAVKRKLELISVGLFVVVNLLVPALWSELYPFTIAPMFSDSPKVYCNYVVFDPLGNRLPLKDFQLQRNYDGNPVGLGAGIKPLPTIDVFGSVPDRITLTEHVKRQLEKHPELEYVTVVQEVVGPISNERVGVVRRNEFSVKR